MTMIDLLLKALLAYLLGSVSGSLLLGRLRGVDVRKSGSGNAGGTNALRTLGVGFALLVVVIDIGKGWLATAWVATLTIPGVPVGPVTAAPICAMAAVLGHIYPVFYGFRGGKGVATWVGGWLAMLPAIVLPLFLVFVSVVLLTGYVGLASIMTAVAALPLAFWLVPDGVSPLLVYAAAAALLIVYTHRSNISRLIGGTENRFDKVRIAHWLRRQ